ncbi:SDR family oxidoreductase [Paenibacillus sp. NEAU-GSW1]|uniref:SDR family NAD(P)-dependent oxidoreductase n=1 Tax=Paenibacillus sp. NEAU-GSW1 TaxID=2682486 RepID=UPI0012E0FBDD|nr:SDR family NAD(P)-dependent oxidoreductase [Paenibacillus sp. NEAU-GSW1]MUT66460.1 SDR family NAD(P)-dependent oxidoreductase [Paenibacillus sp. NEAU-GSW1]
MSKPLIAIVGAGAGVSSAVARKFGANGFRVALVARNTASLEVYANELKEDGIEVFTAAADAADKPSLQEAFRQIRENFGQPDVLLYNAAAISKASPSTLGEQQLIDDFKVNVVGALTSVQQVIPQFIERKEGTIFITGGGFALSPSPDYASLSIGKAGVRSLAYSLAQELKPHHIYVGTVTIGGYVHKDTFYDPDLIAEKYWHLYQNRDETEIVFSQSQPSHSVTQ